MNLVTNEMTIRPQFTPWVGQLFVASDQRSRGVGTAPLASATSDIRDLRYRQLFLFTSGTLPEFYRSKGWTDVEQVSCLGRLRTVMRVETAAAGLPCNDRIRGPLRVAT